MVSVNQTSPSLEKTWEFDTLFDITGIRIEFIKVSEESFNERKNLAFASNMLPDMFGWGLKDDEISQYGKQGMLLSLQDYINWELTPRVMVMMELFPEYESALRDIDGNIYTLQGFNDVPREKSGARWWINETWANKILGKMPETLDDYYNFMVGVKEMGSDYIPFSGMYPGISDNNAFVDGTQPILYAHGFLSRGWEYSDFTNGKVRYNPVDPVYKEFLRYMNRLWSEGLIDPEYFTYGNSGWDQWRAKTGSGMVGTFVDWAPWLGMPVGDLDLWTQWKSADPLVSPYNGNQKVWSASNLSLFSYFTMTKEVKDPAHLIKFANWSYAIGPQGPDNLILPHYNNFFGDYAEMMVYEPDGRIAKPTLTLGAWDRYPEMGFEWEATGDKFWPWDAKLKHYPESLYGSADEAQADLTLKKPWDYLLTSWYNPAVPNSNEGLPANYWEEYLEARMDNPADPWLTYNAHVHHVPYYKTYWPGIVRYTVDEMDEYSMLVTELNAYVDPALARFIMGELNVDSDFDNFVSECNKRGLPRLLEIQQTAVERFLANAK